MSATPLVARAATPRRTTIRIGDSHGDTHALEIGGGDFFVAAGPCSVEGGAMIMEAAEGVQRFGARMLRGGAFKPRTSPYAFQGLGEEGLEMLSEARRRTGLPIVTEVLDVRQVELVARHADVLQVGARNMYNTPLLAAVGEAGLPVLLKRSFSATLKELMGAAEYIAVRGNTKIILCERGIRTFETALRNTLDIGAIPFLQRETHLPVIVDPSHAAGRADFVAPLALAARAAGADGLLVEVHPSPAAALSDGEQSLSLDEFAALMRSLARLDRALGGEETPAIELAPAPVVARGVHTWGALAVRNK